MSTVITVENLGKKYLLNHKTQQQPYVALRDVIAERTAAVGRRLLHPFRSSPLTPHSSRENFWALKDVSFEIKQGDRVGIIGRNGAGKSTLLKILSRIVEPTTGRARIKGRVASLLEVGTGFHPELTGSENIFLNGAILGMTKAEIKKKFDEIVDFAEIEKFLDTPVKRYSSGMYVRLAFAVAAHLEPETLLVDEVLAVGDSLFQSKCIGKMKDISGSGRTIVFVSHQTNAIKELCDWCYLYEKGQIKNSGPPSMIVDEYFAEQVALSSNDMTRTSRRGRGRVSFIETWTEDEKGNRTNIFRTGNFVRICARLFAKEKINLTDLTFSFPLSTETIGLFTEINSRLSGYQLAGSVLGEFVIECELPKIPLNTGRYYYDLYCAANDGVEDHMRKVGWISVIVDDYFGSGNLQKEDRPIFIDHRFHLGG